ncbi:hypothetical protein [Acinetobacter baumannii]|uniref:hypothetical protein n=1 Tax=Acinetobacter baumannii TaxID=470 RepID=UPI002B1BCE92|nr:hypothetical protein [Acinetobacter baumannii]
MVFLLQQQLYIFPYLYLSNYDPSFKTEYYKQVFNRDNINYHFWLPIGSDLHDMSEKVLNIIRSPKN